MRTVSALVLIACSIASPACAQLTEPVDARTSKSAIDAAKSTLEGGSALTGDLAFAASTVLGLRQELPGSIVPPSAAFVKSACASVKKLTTGEDEEQVSLAVAAGGRLSCDWANSVSESASGLVRKAFGSKSMPLIFAALLANDASNGALLADALSSDGAGAIVTVLTDSMVPSGESSWLPYSSENPPRSSAAAAMAIRALGLLSKACGPESKCASSQAQIAEVGAHATVLLSEQGVAGPGAAGDSALSVEISDWMPERHYGDASLSKSGRAQAEAFWASRGSPAAATGTLASGLMELQAGTSQDLDVGADQLAALAEALVQRSKAAVRSGDLKDMAAALEGVVSLSRRNSVAVPVVLTVIPSKGNKIAVQVSDPLGAPLADAGECALRAASARELGGPADATDLQVDFEFTLRKSKKSTKTVFTSSDALTALNSENTNAFEMDLTFSPPDSPTNGPPLHTVESTTRVVRIPLAGSVSSGSVLVSTSSKAQDDDAVLSRADLPGQGSAVIRAGSAHFVHVVFSVEANGKSFQPHQAVLRLSPQKGGQDAFFAARADAAGLRATINVGDRRELGAAADGGTFQASIIIGDSRLLSGVSVPIGLVTLETPAPAPTPEEILYAKPLLHESDTAIAPLKEIIHQFNPDEKQPPIIVPTVVTGGLLVVLAAFVLGVLALGHTWRSPGLAGLLLMAVIIAMIGVLGLYFLQVGPVDNAFAALGLLGLLTVPGLFIGRAALGGLAASEGQ